MCTQTVLGLFNALPPIDFITYVLHFTKLTLQDSYCGLTFVEVNPVKILSN